MLRWVADDAGDTVMLVVYCSRDVTGTLRSARSDDRHLMSLHAAGSPVVGPTDCFNMHALCTPRNYELATSGTIMQC